MRTFAELLSLYIRRTGITDAELARAVGVSRQTIFRWREGETGRPNKREDVLAIAGKLRLSPEERDTLLLAAGFRPEEVASPGSDAAGYEADDGQKPTVIDDEGRGHETGGGRDLGNHMLKAGSRRIFLSLRFLLLITIILVWIVVMAIIDCSQNASFNPFE